jgi:hypothetical protein
MLRITDRDVRLIAKCAAAQWLTTSQVQRLFFPDVTLDRVRKRLRKLAGAAYLFSAQPHAMAEMLHTAGRQGKCLLEERGWGVQLTKRLPEHLEHLQGINDIRVAVESDSCRVQFFFAHWELGEYNWPYPVIPDAVFCADLGREATFGVEYDRATERHQTLLQKLHQYRALCQSFPLDALIFVADSATRVDHLGSLVRKSHLPFPGFAAVLEEVSGQGMFTYGFLSLRRPEKMSLAEFIAQVDDGAWDEGL